MNRSNAECGMRNAECENQLQGSSAVIPNLKGFTLIEVLLALAIFAGVVTVIYSVFSTTGATVEQAEKIRDDTDAARTLISRIQNDIANAYWKSDMEDITYFYSVKAEESTAEKKQRLDSLFLTTLTNWRRPDSKEMELWGAGYSFQDKPDGTGRVLVRTEKRELSKDVPPLEGGVEYEITDQVEDLRYRYTNDGTTWRDEWDTRKQHGLPSVVEISLVMSGNRVYVSSVDVRNK